MYFVVVEADSYELPFFLAGINQLIPVESSIITGIVSNYTVSLGLGEHLHFLKHQRYYHFIIIINMLFCKEVFHCSYMYMFMHMYCRFIQFFLLKLPSPYFFRVPNVAFVTFNRHKNKQVALALNNVPYMCKPPNCWEKD